MDLFSTHLNMCNFIHNLGKGIRKDLNNEIQIEQKQNRFDLVTNVDKNTEKRIIAFLKSSFPKSKIISEEGYGTHVTDMSGYVWTVDPIDGTMNFITQKTAFGILISLYKDGTGLLGYIYDVINDKLYSGIKGYGAYCNQYRLNIPENLSLENGLVIIDERLIRKYSPSVIEKLSNSLGFRSYGSATYETLSVIRGKAVAYINCSTQPWDIAPALVIAKELNLICTQPDGSPFNMLSENKIIFATARAHQYLLGLDF